MTCISCNNVSLYMVDTLDFHPFSHACCFERTLEDQGKRLNFLPLFYQQVGLEQ